MLKAKVPNLLLFLTFYGLNMMHGDIFFAFTLLYFSNIPIQQSGVTVLLLRELSFRTPNSDFVTPKGLGIVD